MKVWFYIVLVVSAASCHPKVISFTALPTRVKPGDSVHLRWETKGTASMSFREKKIYVPPDSVETWEFILTASCGKKVSAPSIRQVVVGEQRDMLALALDSISGDSLVYSAQKDVAFQAYAVVMLTIRGGDPVTVGHSGQTCVVGSSAAATCMQGLIYSGYWTLKVKMTAAEAADHHRIPGDYFLLATITPK